MYSFYQALAQFPPSAYFIGIPAALAVVYICVRFSLKVFQRSQFLSSQEKLALAKIIDLIEASSSAEIRIHLENYCFDTSTTGPHARALELFHELRMDETTTRTGVLIYIAIKSKKIAIIGDEAITRKVTPDFWNMHVNEISQAFQANNYYYSISVALMNIGEVLIEHFPIKPDDIDELSNAISGTTTQKLTR